MDRKKIIQRALEANNLKEVKAALPDCEQWLELKPGDAGVQAAIDQMAQTLEYLALDKKRIPHNKKAKK
jgi:hypothetical protein